MRLMPAAAALLLAALGLAGCAGVPAAERAAFCETVDWREYGRNDGRLGIPSGERAERFADCRELGHAPEFAAYEAGRAEGLEAHCTLENGYEAGREGRRYRGVCPSEREIAFLQGYEQGRRERRRAWRVQPRFGFGIGFGHFRPHHHHHWWLGPRFHYGGVLIHKRRHGRRYRY